MSMTGMEQEIKTELRLFIGANATTAEEHQLRWRTIRANALRRMELANQDFFDSVARTVRSNPTNRAECIERAIEWWLELIEVVELDLYQAGKHIREDHRE